MSSHQSKIFENLSEPHKIVHKSHNVFYAMPIFTVVPWFVLPVKHICQEADWLFRNKCVLTGSNFSHGNRDKVKPQGPNLVTHWPTLYPFPSAKYLCFLNFPYAFQTHLPVPATGMSIVLCTFISYSPCFENNSLIYIGKHLAAPLVLFFVTWRSYHGKSMRSEWNIGDEEETVSFE